MNYSNYIILLFICLSSSVHANHCYIFTKNNFMKFYLKLENYYLKMLNEFGCRIDSIHTFTCNKINSLSYKYNTLSYEEKELLELIGFFI
jgi:hypothetical protein